MASSFLMDGLLSGVSARVRSQVNDILQKEVARGIITLEDVDKKSGKDISRIPGAIPSSNSSVNPECYKVGWRAFTDLDKHPEDEDQNLVRLMYAWLFNQYYGQGYHSAAIIVFAVFATHFITRYNLGYGWLFILLGFCSTRYTTYLARVRHCARDDIRRELVKTTIASEHESAEWINQFLDRYWLIYEPVLSSAILATVGPILSAIRLPFLESLRFTHLTLGNKAPRIDKVRTFPQTESDEILMDWGFSFAPNDVSDLTPRQQASKVNPKIVLSIPVGKGPASASFPILVEDMTFTGLLRIRLKLISNFPHIQTMNLSFLEKPHIDYVLKPIGGETFGFDIPGLSSSIREAIHSILGPMMYHPNVFSLNLEQLLSGAPIDMAIGVIKVTVYGARSISANKIGGGMPDPYVNFSINNVAQLARTKHKSSTHNPTWNETKFLIVNNLTDSLVLTVMDYNELFKDTEIGASMFELSKLNEDVTQDMATPILKAGKQKGELRFDVSYYPVLKPQTNEPGVEELPESNVGIVRFTIHQAKDFEDSGVHPTDLNTYAKVYLGSSSTPIHTTFQAKRTAKPAWESTTEFFCANRSSSIITVKVVDRRDNIRDPILGFLSVRLQDLLDTLKDPGHDWWPLSGCKSGRVRLTADWRPLNVAGGLCSADQYVPPIGVVRLWLKQATDVKNVEATLGSKSDPYVRVFVNNIIQARTVVVNNNLNPVWDEIIYAPIHSLKETLLLEVMDYQHVTKDRSLGTIELKISELAQELPKGPGNPRISYESTGKMDKSERIRLDRENRYKGRLHYVAEFLPAFMLQGLKFETDRNELESAVEAYENGNDVAGDSESMSSEGEPVAGAGTTTEPIDSQNNSQCTGTTYAAASSGATVVSKTANAREGSPTSMEAHSANRTDAAKREDEGIYMSKDELLTHQSGIIIFYVKSGELSKRCRLEVLLDNGYWPTFSTTRPYSHHANWQHVGEGFLKEIDFGRVWLRLNEADEGEKDVIIGEWKDDVKSFLSRTLGSPTRFELTNQDGQVTGEVEIETRYIPVPVELEPRETVNNQGGLRVTLLTGHDLPSADLTGKSDPFTAFYLNGERVFKSTIKKKTLNPEWHEDFYIEVPSRIGADFQIEVFDWNQLAQAKSLGTAKINLEDIEPLLAADCTLALSSEKRGAKSQIKISMVFQPEILMKSRKATSTFSPAGYAMAAIGSAPINAGKGVLQSVVGVLKRGMDSEDEHNFFGWGSQPQPSVAVSDIPVIQVFKPFEDGERLGVPTAPDTDGYSAPTEPGVLRVSILDAKDLIGGPDVKPYAVVRIGESEFKTKHHGKTVVPEWNETFEFPAGPSTTKLHILLFDHKTLGKDRPLGEAEVDIWQHIKAVSGSTANISVEIKNGSGLVAVQLAFNAETTTLGRKSSVSYLRNKLHARRRLSGLHLVDSL